jgi:hypothetical protein
MENYTKDHNQDSEFVNSCLEGLFKYSGQKLLATMVWGLKENGLVEEVFKWR